MPLHRRHDAGIVRVLSFDAESIDDIPPESEHPSLVAQQREYEQPFGDDLVDALSIQSQPVYVDRSRGQYS